MAKSPKNTNVVHFGEVPIVNAMYLFFTNYVEEEDTSYFIFFTRIS